MASSTTNEKGGLPGKIPRFVTYTSPVATSTAPIASGSRATTLPLNLIGLIVSFLDDLGDIARVTRTCRLLYYMSLPQLYQNVTLHSYRDIRYVHGRPEGFGSGSPFQMALNGLVTKSHAAMVKDFRVHGEWNEVGAEDFAKGRIPDNTMMLNLILRAATDKMVKLKAFSWGLDCKPLKTLYQGLSSHGTLTSLTIRFPRSRVPRPSVVIPPMVNLRAFRAMDIDPLCYPDDISVLLLSSKKLEDVRLHFSPRMRQESESSLSWSTYFGRCLRAGYKLPVKHVGVQNFYGPTLDGLHELLDPKRCKSVTFLDIFGGVKGASANIFMDDTWKAFPTDITTTLKAARFNEPTPQHVGIMSAAQEKMERLFLVSAKATHAVYTPDMHAPVTPEEPYPQWQTAELCQSYIHAITRHHGATMTHLLLWDLWHLTSEDIGEIVRFCPNLEQLGVGINSSDSMRVIHLLVPFLPKLRALRLLLTDQVENECTKTDHWAEMETVFARWQPCKLKWLGVGRRILHLGDLYETVAADRTVVRKVEVKEVGFEQVKEVEIWKLDCLDIAADPVPTFDAS